MTIYRPQTSAELAAVTTSTNDTVILRAGVVYAGSSVPAGLLNPAGVTLGYEGTGALPVIDCGVVRADWTFDAGNNVYSRPAYGTDVLGNVTEDGVMMRFTEWDTNIATTAAAMTDGQSLPYWSGSMTYDYNNRIVYIRPSSGTAAQHEYKVSETLDPLSSGANVAGLTVDGIEVRQPSRHGLLLTNRKGATITNLIVRQAGGKRNSGAYVGNGVQFASDCYGILVDGLECTDIFDTVVTSQLYASVSSRLSSHEYRNVIGRRFGMHGVEVSCQTANQHASDIYASDIVLEDSGTYSWSNRSGSAFAVVCVAGAVETSRATRIFGRRITATRMRKLYNGGRHGGVCGIEDSTGIGTYESKSTINVAGVPGQFVQRDILRNVTDSQGAPTGSSFQIVSSAAPPIFGNAAGAIL